MPATATARFNASELVKAWCGWHIAPSKTETVFLRGASGGRLFLPSLHVTAVTSVLVDDVAVTDYQWSPEGELWRPTGWWSDRLRGVAVTLEHGYDAMPVPVQAVIDGMAERASSAPATMQQIGPFRFATGADGSPVGGNPSLWDQSVLRAYRIPVVS